MPDYNLLLVHQNLLRALVEDYRRDPGNESHFTMIEGQDPAKYNASSVLEFSWRDHRDFSLDPAFKPEHFRKLVDEGLMDLIGENAFEINANGIEAVENDFRRLEKVAVSSQSHEVPSEMPGPREWAVIVLEIVALLFCIVELLTHPSFGAAGGVFAALIVILTTGKLFTSQVYNSVKVWRFAALILLVLLVVGIVGGVWFWPDQETQNDKTFHIENIPQTVFTWGTNGTARLFIVYDETPQVNYRVDYALPSENDQPGYAGLVFVFSKAVDFADYDFVEVTVSYGDKETRCELNFTDMAEQRSGVLLDENSLPSGSSIKRLDEEMIIRIPLRDGFGQVNLKAVAKVGFTVDTAFTTGEHTFVVKGVWFLNS